MGKIDPQKLATYVKFNGTAPVHRKLDTSFGLDDRDTEEIAEQLEDDASETSKAARKMTAGYMELKDDAGAFSCGNCRFAAHDGVCTNMAVRAEVDPMHGCCNSFTPINQDLIVFPPQANDGDMDEDDPTSFGEAEAERSDEDAE